MRYFQITRVRCARWALPLTSALACLSLGACVPHRLYHAEPDEYLTRIPLDDSATTSADLAVIEFDDSGVFWKIDQLNEAVDLIRRRNAESSSGVLVIVYIHGWKNNADPALEDGALRRFRDSLATTAKAQRAKTDGALAPDHVIGVFLGWRGDTSDVPLQEQFTFWDRRATAERVASLNMREALLRVMNATKERPESKCFAVGHSMGGLILGKTMAPVLTTVLLAGDAVETRLPVDLVLLQNPAIDGLAAWQLIDFLKRHRATLHFRDSRGNVEPARGPIIASITSEADSATGAAYPFGRSLASMFASFRTDFAPGAPSQRTLATNAEGHIPFLVSHTATVENGEVVLRPVPGAWNDTPFWIVRVSREISRDHGEVNNAMYGKLIQAIIRLNRVYEADVETWITSR